jgi:hypothetical protein
VELAEEVWNPAIVSTQPRSSCVEFEMITKKVIDRNQVCQIISISKVLTNMKKPSANMPILQKMLLEPDVRIQ